MDLPYSAGVIWMLIVAVAVGTYLFRVSFVALFEYLDEVPPWTRQVLRFVPMAVLATLVAPALVAPDGTVSISAGNERLIAGTVAAVAAHVTENMLVTIGVGMSVLYLLRFLL